MKLVLKKKYKSLGPFETRLEDFTVLTGLNGSGKTQLLSAIMENLIEATDNNNHRIFPVKLVNNITLAPNDVLVVKREQLDTAAQEIYNQYFGFLQLKSQNPDASLGASIPNGGRVVIIEEIAKNASKKIDDLIIDDFYDYYPLKQEGYTPDPFYHNFAHLFKRYYDAFEINEYRQFKNQIKGHKEVSFFNESEFYSKYGEPPWDFVNRVLATANFDYHFNSPLNTNRNSPFELKLINKFNKAEISIKDLSSGEKVIMSMSLAVYNSNFESNFPSLLLMDEPDASLHPSMIKQFLSVIEKIFINEKKVKVIIATHSPTTIALAPEESIYAMNKTEPRIKKVSKDGALKLLTAGVPSISVLYENRRQVFVESENDVKYFDKIYQKILTHLNPEVSISFISSGDSKKNKFGQSITGSDQVINITNILRKAGNQFVWGIIEWDGKNSATHFVKVLGENIRYGVENYIFDPILLAALLVQSRELERSDIGLDAHETYVDFRSMPVERLQLIIAFISSKLSLNVNDADATLVNSKLINGLEVQIPKWVFQTRGHDFESIVLKTFPGLNKIKKNKEELLKLEILEKIVDDIPELISIDFVTLFSGIQDL